MKVHFTKKVSEDFYPVEGHCVICKQEIIFDSMVKNICGKCFEEGIKKLEPQASGIDYKGT